MPVDKLELLKRAKEYMESLATGLDPVSGQQLSRTDPMGSERMQRCFAFVASTLAEVIAQREKGADPGGSAGTCRKALPGRASPETPVKAEKAGRKRVEKAVFAISGEQLLEVAATEAPVSISEMARRLNAAAGLEKSDMTGTLLAGGLEEMGFLEYREGTNGVRRREPTSAGRAIGLERIRCINGGGQPYILVVLNNSGQRFLLDNLEAVLDTARRAREKQEAERVVRKAEKLAEKARRAVEEARQAAEETE